MTRTESLHALLTLASRHLVVWAPGTWGPCGWRRLDTTDSRVTREESSDLDRLNRDGMVAVDPRVAAHRYFTPRQARLTDEGTALLVQWDRLQVRAG